MTRLGMEPAQLFHAEQVSHIPTPTARPYKVLLEHSPVDVLTIVSPCLHVALYSSGGDHVTMNRTVLAFWPFTEMLTTLNKGNCQAPRLAFCIR